MPPQAEYTEYADIDELFEDFDSSGWDLLTTLSRIDDRSSTLGFSSPITPQRPQTSHEAHAMQTPPEVVDLTSGVDDSPVAQRRLLHETNDGQEQGSRKRKRADDSVQIAEGAPEPAPVPIPTAPRLVDDGKERIGRMSCIICMEQYTDMATGLCGHVFCHECFSRALVASERQHDRGAGTCPSCRKPIFRKRANHIIPINFMKRETYKARATGSRTKT